MRVTVKLDKLQVVCVHVFARRDVACSHAAITVLYLRTGVPATIAAAAIFVPAGTCAYRRPGDQADPAQAKSAAGDQNVVGGVQTDQGASEVVVQCNNGVERACPRTVYQANAGRGRTAPARLALDQFPGA